MRSIYAFQKYKKVAERKARQLQEAGVNAEVVAVSSWPWTDEEGWYVMVPRPTTGVAAYRMGKQGIEIGPIVTDEAESVTKTKD